MARIMVNAFNIKEAKEHIGRIVYRSYRPQQVGKIVDARVFYYTRIIGGKAVRFENGFEFLVHWKGSGKKPAYQEWEQYLADFESLVVDHERKGKKFRKVLNEAKSTL